MRRLLPLLFVLAAPALAQEPGQTVDADLDGDGRIETYSLADTGAGVADLVVEGPQGRRVAEAVAWAGGMAGQRPELALSPAGSVQVVSRNDSVGRSRWTLTLTLAYREGDLRVAGITYAWLDTLEPETGFGGCDLNLLTGRGVLFGPGGERAVAAPAPAPRLWDWNEADLPEFVPAECLD